MTGLDEKTPITIRRNWNGSDQGTATLAALSGFHWAQTGGGDLRGFARVSPRPMVHAYVWCDAVDGLDYAHSCMHGPPPHRINVVIVAKDNRPAVMRHLKKLASTRKAETR
jgi:hypothetical protein